MKKLLVVDGNSILNRAFYGVRPLTTRDGRNTNAIFGFINMLYKQLTDLEPDYASIAFDLKAPTFRHKACDYYKATRKGMPEELAEQLEPAKNIARLMGFHELSLEGYEADDILGTLSMLSDEHTHAYLMTGDRDSYQLITDTTSVLYVSTKETTICGKEKIARAVRRSCAARFDRCESAYGRHVRQHSRRSRNRRKDGGVAHCPFRFARRRLCGT